MKGYNVCGIQQIGIGVENLGESWKWYADKFGMDCRIFEDEAEAKLMLPYTGGEPRSRHALLALNLQSGGGFEIWQYKGRKPELIKNEIRLEDKGIISCKMKVKNIETLYTSFKNSNINIISDLTADPAGKLTFFIKDPYGNIFQLVEGLKWFMDEKKLTGGAYGAMIGVTDIDKARKVYSEILGYDEVVYDKTGIFDDLKGISGGDQTVRRVLLRNSIPFSGPFSKLLGESYMELVTVPGIEGKKTYEGRFWGDPGFIHLCFDIRGMDHLQTTCVKTGFPFTVDSRQQEGKSFDMGEAAGHFAYIEDPDGTLIEFVETHKLPVMKKLGWYLNLKKMERHKSLPVWILKALRFSRVKNSRISV